jgi:hypothetical protein
LKDKIHKYENGMILNFTKNRQNMVSEVNIWVELFHGDNFLKQSHIYDSMQNWMGYIMM